MIRYLIEDIRVQREGILAPALWVLLAHRLSCSIQCIRFRPLRRLFLLPVLVIQRCIEIPVGVEIGMHAQIGRRLRIEHWGGIVIHGRTVIGDDCLIRHGVTFGNRGGDPLAAPRVGNGVEIGAGAKILGAIHIGDKAIIGANAVVISDVPAGALAVGVPAKIKRRSEGDHD